MSEAFEAPRYILTEEDGTETEYELVFRDMLRGTEYGVLAPADENEEAALCIVEILADEEQEAENVRPVEDDAVIEQVFSDFLEAFPELADESEEME